jgi:hypothetical protein
MAPGMTVLSGGFFRHYAGREFLPERDKRVLFAAGAMPQPQRRCGRI